MRKIGDLSKKAMKNKNLEKAAQAAFICNIAKNVLGDLFDPLFLKNVKIISFKGECLYLLVSDSSCAQEIALRQKDIIETINEKVKNDIIKKVRFKNRAI